MKIDEMIQKAYENCATDVHMLPDCPVMFRINGRMTALEEEGVRPAELADMISELLNDRQREKLEEDGEIDTAVLISGCFRIRANIYRQQGGYAAALRILSSQIPTPEELEIPRPVVELTKENKGLVLITGETGSGKTTTLASLLNLIASRDTKHIITIEDPIEYLIPGGRSIVSQREIGSDAVSYAKAVKAAQRQDADVIFIGELSDMETITEAIAAAESGHLVFSSLYTNRTEDTLHRLIDIFPEYMRQQVRTQLAAVLKGVIARQLLPRCDREERSAVFEIMLEDKEIQTLLREDRISQISSVIEARRETGMQTMDDAILSAYMRSRISEETAIACANDADTMRRRMTIY